MEADKGAELIGKIEQIQGMGVAICRLEDPPFSKYSSRKRYSTGESKAKSKRWISL